MRDQIESNYVPFAIKHFAPNIVSTDWALCFLFALIFLLCYSPVLLCSYGFTDDYWYLARSLHEAHWPFSLVPELCAAGRPLAVFTVWSSFVIAKTIANLVYLRLTGVLLLSWLGYVLYSTLTKVGWGRLLAFCLSAIICSLPSFQVVISWAAISNVAVLLMIIATVSAHIAEKSFDCPARSTKLRLVAYSVLLLSVSLAASQCYAMFYLVTAAIFLFRPGATMPEVARKFVWFMVPFVIACGLEFIIYEVGRYLYGTVGTNSIALERTHLTHHLWSKVHWFIQEPLLNSLNLGNIFPHLLTGLVVAGYIFIGLVLYFAGTVKQRIVQLMLALSLVPLSYLPPMAAAEDWATYRTIIALSSLIVLYTFFASVGFGKLFSRCVSLRLTLPVAIISLTILSLSTAFCNVLTFFTVPQALELGLIKEGLFMSKTPHLVTLRREDSLVSDYRYDEFGCPSTFQLHVRDPLLYLLKRERTYK